MQSGGGGWLTARQMVATPSYPLCKSTTSTNKNILTHLIFEHLLKNTMFTHEIYPHQGIVPVSVPLASAGSKDTDRSKQASHHRPSDLET